MINKKFMKLIVNFSSFFFQRHRRTTYIWYHLLPTLLTLSNYVNSQCFGGVETYEKTSGMYCIVVFYQCFKKNSWNLQLFIYISCFLFVFQAQQWCAKLHFAIPGFYWHNLISQLPGTVLPFASSHLLVLHLL